MLNEAKVSIFTRNTEAITAQFIPTPLISITTDGENSTYSWTVDVEGAPASQVSVPKASTDDSTSGVRFILTGGAQTTYENNDIIKAVILGGGSQIRFTISNNGDSTGIDGAFTVEGLNVGDGTTDFYQGSSNTFPLEVQRYAVSPVEHTSCAETSITRYGRRDISLEFPFFGGIDGASVTAKGQNRADEEIAHNSTAHGHNVQLRLEGSNSTSINAILTREMNDRININSTTIHRLQNINYYITGGNYTMDAGGHLTANWSLEEAT